MADGVPALAEPSPVVVDGDGAGYRDRVATAVEEIRAGDYRKVILSRCVDVPFALDFPSTYRLGRRHNTPARSFLLRLGGIRALGYSPELVAEVRDDGVVVTEPLAGTRARTGDPAIDAVVRAELESDAKEIVEHAISVRTSVDEITEVAEPGSTVVADFMTVRERGACSTWGRRCAGGWIPRGTGWMPWKRCSPRSPRQGSQIGRNRRNPAARRVPARPVLRCGGDVLGRRWPRRRVDTAGGLPGDGRCWLRAGAGVIAESRPEREFEETCEKLATLAPYLIAQR